jgi:hypothetical protein
LFERPQAGHEVVTALNEITRGYGFESSATDIANLLTVMFPDEQSDAAAAGLIEIVRASRPSSSFSSGLSPGRAMA